MTTAGAVTEYASPLASAVAITRGGDGALWFVDTNREQPRPVRAGRRRARLHRVVEVFPLGISVSGAVDITPAPTGNDLYVAASNALVRVEPTLTNPNITPIPLGPGSPAAVHSNATGVWWVDSINKRIGRYAGTTVTEWALPRSSGVPNEFTLASDGSRLVHEQGRRPDRALLRRDRTAGPAGYDRAAGNAGYAGDAGHAGNAGCPGNAGNGRERPAPRERRVRRGRRATRATPARSGGAGRAG